jgi:glutathione synthase/RimK-type ligase-like ATP-grasp enzyme
LILIVSNPAEDGHLRPVVTELVRRGYEWQIFDPATYPADATITVEGGSCGIRPRLTSQYGEIDLSRVRSVWYRRPGTPEFPERLLPQEREWIGEECRHLFRGLWASLDALWVSQPDRIFRASLKVHQLRLAADLGFRIPRWVVTNDIATATQFLDSSPSGMVVKVLSRPILVTATRFAILYTHVVTPEDREHLESVRHGPTFLQDFVQKTMDIRVTVIGDKLFAIGIESADDEAARIDFRLAGVYDLPHRPIELPPPLQAACMALVRRLGLEFGAIDLLLTPQGDYVFLEINPNGQWLWLEQMTGVPLTKAMCDLLTRGHGPDAGRSAHGSVVSWSTSPK